MESLHFDTGVLALAEPSAGGSLGYDVSCGTQDYQLTTAGYPGGSGAGEWGEVDRLTIMLYLSASC